MWPVIVEAAGGDQPLSLLAPWYGLTLALPEDLHTMDGTNSSRSSAPEGRIKDGERG